MEPPKKFLVPTEPDQTPLPSLLPSSSALFWWFIGLGIILYVLAFIFHLTQIGYASVRSTFISDSQKIDECKKHKASTPLYDAYGCQRFQKHMEYETFGEQACAKHLEMLSGIRTTAEKAHRINDELVNRVWFVTDRDKKNLQRPPYSLAECRRFNYVFDDSSLLQWRQVSAKNGKPITKWTEGDDNVYYKHSLERCVGLSIKQCKLVESDQRSTTSSGTSSLEPYNYNGGREAILEQRARSTIEDFDNWSGEGPAPQVIPAMEALWRCRKYGDC